MTYRLVRSSGRIALERRAIHVTDLLAEPNEQNPGRLWGIRSTFGAAGTSAVGMERVLRHRRARPSATRGQLQIFEVIVVAVRIWPEAVSEP